VTDPPALKQFKLDRITKAENLRQPNEFEYDNEGNLTGRRWPRDLVTRPLFPLDKILDGTIHNYLPPPDAPQARDIEIMVDKRVAKWAEEEMIHPQQRTAVVTLADGSKALKFKLTRPTSRSSSHEFSASVSSSR
jgi:YD repeat-containing protein